MVKKIPKMTKYIIIDIETPDKANTRISSICIHTLTINTIELSYSSLVNPEIPFDEFNVNLTGITTEMVASAPTFPQVWEEIRPVLDSGIIVGHFAEFDLSVIWSCLKAYGLSWKPSVQYLCTVKIGREVLPSIRHNLNVMCEYYGIELEHHKAESDSRACGEILLRYIDAGVDVEMFISEFAFPD